MPSNPPSPNAMGHSSTLHTPASVDHRRGFCGRLTAPTKGIQRLISRLVHACNDFGLTTSIKKTNTMRTYFSITPHIHINSYDTLDIDFDIDSTITSNLSPNQDLNKRIEKASPAIMAWLSKRVAMREPNADYPLKDDG